MEVVVAVLALDSGLITAPVFVAILFSAVASSMLMGPWMHSAMNRRAAVRLIDFLTAESLIANLAATDSASAIRLLAAKAAQQAGVDGDTITAEALARENDFGTGIGAGMAIPHVRMDGLRNPVVAVGRAPHGLEWNAPDGKPVYRVFFLLTPEDVNDVHVQLLAEVARVMQIPANQYRFDLAKDGADLWQTLSDLFQSSGQTQKAGGFGQK